MIGDLTVEKLNEYFDYYADSLHSDIWYIDNGGTLIASSGYFEADQSQSDEKNAILSTLQGGGAYRQGGGSGNYLTQSALMDPERNPFTKMNVANINQQRARGNNQGFGGNQGGFGGNQGGFGGNRGY